MMMVWLVHLVWGKVLLRLVLGVVLLVHLHMAWGSRTGRRDMMHSVVMRVRLHRVWGSRTLGGEQAQGSHSSIIWQGVHVCSLVG